MLLKYKDVEEGDRIDEEILENMVWCTEFSVTTSSPATHGYALRIWYSK